MERLTRKLILEILNEDDSSPKEIEEPVKIEEPVELDKGEKVNFILSVLSDLNNKALDIFNYLTPYITNIDPEENLSEDNKSLLASVYEDISLILGKLSQGLKDNSPENIQNAIDDGQTLAQETITPEPVLKEGLNLDKEKLWHDLMSEVDMGDYFDNMQDSEKEEKEKFFEDPRKELQNWKEYYKENSEMLGKIKAFEDKYFKKLEESVLKEDPDKYGLPTDDELDAQRDILRKEYEQKVQDLYSKTKEARKNIKLKEFNEVLDKLNSNPALEELKKQLLNNEILKFNVTDKKSGLMASSFGDGLITFNSDLPDFKYININLNLNDFKFSNALYEKRLDSQISLLNLINDNLKNIIDLNKEKNEGEFKYNLTGSLGNTLKRAIGEKAFSKISKLVNVENGSHWAWGGRFMLFEYEGNLYHFEVYNDQVNININERTPGLRFRVFNKVENELGWYENPIIEELGLKGLKEVFPEVKLYGDYILI